MSIQKEKIDQAVRILDEIDMDIWLILARETSVQTEPVLPLMVGSDVTWQSFFIYSRDGQAIALVGKFDEENLKRSGCFTRVMTYTEDVAGIFRELIAELNPKTIAINYAKDSPTADGLTYGMYQHLLDYLAGTGFAERLVSAEELCLKVFSRKTASEIKRLTNAARLSIHVWDLVVSRIKIGLTEKEIAGIIENEIKSAGGVPSFPTIVNAGDKTKPGHGEPTDALIEPGDLLHVDFGIRLNGYCSDLQRLVYFRREDEDEAPPELIRAFNTVRDIITASAEMTVPGAVGHNIDRAARQKLIDSGYEEYQHALGHQLGRNVHDGGALIGPLWPRYGKTPTVPLETGNAFTLELEIMLPGIGCVGLEEDICVNDEGAAEFLCDRQVQLTVK